MSDAVTLSIDGREIEARAGEMLIAVTDRAGIPIPRFCYHRKLSVAANCRMCLVEVAGARGPAPACATPAADGMEVRTRSAAAREAQRAAMEFLLVNHPLDCPICDQGGECELQDVALEYGRGAARYAEARRVVPDPDLGPLVSTDMTRCIHCTRCVRFTEEIAGERELGAFGRGEFMKIGTYVHAALRSELSGCVIDLCPVGALNARPSRMRARAWELDRAPGLGEHDGVGSRLHHHTLRGRVVRSVPRETEDLNECWLSDRDRFSYQAAEHPDRLRAPQARRHGHWREIDWDEALGLAARALAAEAPKAGLIHPSATIEECLLFERLLRGRGAATVEHRLRQSDFRGGAQHPLMPGLGLALAEVAELDLAILVGAFPRHDQPILGHRLRQAALGGTEVRALDLAPRPWNLPLAEERILAPHAWLKTLRQTGRGALGRRLKQARRAAIWLGPLALAHPDAALLYAAARELAARAGAVFGTLPEGANAAGAWLAGCVAHRGPGGAALPTGRDLEAACGASGAVWVLHGLDPACDMHNPARARAALSAARAVIGLSAFATPALLEHCDLLLPLATVGERGGHLLSLEGRWQAMTPAAAPPGAARPGAGVLADLAVAAGVELPWRGADELLRHARSLAGAGDAAGAPFAGPARLGPSGLLRAGGPSIYQQDPATRHAHALQQTELAAPPRLRAHPATLRAAGLDGAPRARLVQDGAELLLPLDADERMPEGCVHLPTGDPALAALGAAFGAVELRRV